VTNNKTLLFINRVYWYNLQRRSKQLSEKNENFKAILKKYFRKDEVLLLPNILCYMRILFVIVFLCLYLIPFEVNGNDKAGVYFATATMITAAYTDFLDGFIARKFNMMSSLGTLLDPIADKLLQLAVTAALCSRFYQFPSVWLMFTVFIIKETVLVITDVILARNNKTYGGAKWYGKISTFIFYLSLGTLLLGGPFIVEAYPLSVDPFHLHLAIDTLTTIATFFLSLAFVMYLVLFFKKLKHGPNEITKPLINNKEDKRND